MSQNGQTHFKNIAAIDAIFLCLIALGRFGTLGIKVLTKTNMRNN